MFRCKVKTQFSPQIIKNLVTNKGKSIDKLATVSVLSLPIPAKSYKEVVKISKIFKKNSATKEKKSYTQVSSQNTNTARETLKIKKAFLNLQNRKIENIQKIISGKEKPKPCINITTKELSQKQVIVSMNSDNANNFIKDSSSHVTNINRALKNIKSEVMLTSYAWKTTVWLSLPTK